MTLRALPASPRPWCAALTAAIALLPGLLHAQEAPAAPPAWREAAGAALRAADPAALAQWWQQFDDPDLTAQVSEALQRNPDLRTAQATLAQARASRAVIEAGGKPQFSTPLSATRSRTDSSDSKLYKLGFSASWELDWNDAIAEGLKAADADVRQAAETLSATRMSITAEVGLAYFQWRGAQRRLQLAEDSLRSQETTQRLIDWKQQAGLLGALEREQARLSTEQTRASLPALRTEQAQYEHQLALLTGRAPAALPAPAVAERGAGDGPRTEALLARLGAGVPADLLRRRPDLRAAEAAVAAQQARLTQTRRDADPTVKLTGSLGLQAINLGKLLSSGGTSIAALGLSLDWPLWEGGKREALVAEQEAALQLARLGYESAVLGALVDVEDALAATRESVARCAALEQAVQAATAVLTQTGWRVEAGLSDTASLLDAQRSRLTLQTSLASARTDQALQLVRLYKALGGGWAEDPDAAPSSDPAAGASPSSRLFWHP